MGNTNTVTPLIHPSQNDVNGGVTNDGKRLLEKYIREWHKALNGISYQITGNALPTSAANLVLIVPAGSAYIAGYYVAWAQTNVTLPASSVSHIFVKLISASGLATNVQIEDNTSGTYPADAIKLGVVTTIGTAITTSTDQRLLDGNQRIRRVVISATGVTNWIVPANVTRGEFHQWAPGGGGGGGGGASILFGTNGGDGAPGNRGGYLRAMVTLTPGSTIVITNGAGGSPGSGGAQDADGSGGGAGGASSISGPGFSFSNPGGPGGTAGLTGGTSNATHALWKFRSALPSASSGSLDVAIDGGGNGPGIEGAGGTSGNPGTAGGTGRPGVTIIEF